MQAYDLIVLVVLVAATIWGARHGFAKQLASLASLAVGYLVAVQFRQPVAEMIEATPPWNIFAAMLILFMGTSLAIWIAFQFVQGTIEKVGLKNFDQQMGGLLGLLKGMVICMALTMFVVVMVGDRFRDEVLHSYSGYAICRVLTRSKPLVPAEWRQTIEPYLTELDQLAFDTDASTPGAEPTKLGQAIAPSVVDDDESIRPNRSPQVPPETAWPNSTATRPWTTEQRR